MAVICLNVFRANAFWRLAYFSIIVSSVFAAILQVAWAGERATEVEPEIDAFLKLSNQTRIFLLGDMTRNLTEGTTEGEAGIHLDVTLKPFLRRHLRDADWERDRYLWMRIGYLETATIDGGGISGTERTGIVETTARFALANDFWLVNRGRIDLRDISDQFSQRYRYRIGVERLYTVGDAEIVPYAQAEVYYDSRYSTWNRQQYRTGAEISLTDEWRIEPYYARQNDSGSASGNVNIVGFVFKYFH